MQLLAGLALALLAGVVAATCPPRALTDSAQVRLTGESVLIVTHATSTHDARFSTKRGVDEAVRFAKNHKIPVIFLQDESPEQYYFTEDCEPDYRVFSEGGEIKFDIQAAHVYVVGGHLELCLSATLHDILYIWARQPIRSRTITFLMDGIYSNGKSVEESDVFFNDFRKFMSVVTYGRPAGEHWPKLSLLETLGVIQREEHELEYLRKVLPRWDRTMSKDYRVELQLNDSVAKVLRPAPGWYPPTLRFHFVDSAINLGR